ncbi:YutD family protein [Cohnella sp. GCM10027633]|uniref:YutD family protein n=1 Tax=unclassified Cohnella TaxID=2636738 RepID=UPI00363CFEA2
MAGGNAYSVMHENKNGWNPEAFRERFSEVLERFDYIVGDWGYSQLRLRGFYKDGHPRATKESSISSFVDYINEYCNFGCAYFVLVKIDSKTLSPEELELSQQNAAAAAATALGEAGEQAAETAAAAATASVNGMLMRWPLKERPGGPVRVPNVTVSAVARAAADAERRNANKGDHSGGSSHQRGGSHSRNDRGHDGGSRHGKSSHGSGGGDRRQGQGSGNHERGGQQGPGQGNHGQGRGQHHNGPRGPRPQQNAEGNHKPAEGRPQAEGNAHPNAEAARNGSRWPGKNRRRKSFGGKPGQGPRPEGGPRSESSGNPRASE